MARNDKKQRTVMRSQTALTVTASKVGGAPVFTVQPSGTVSFTQGNAGTQDVSFAATDPNNDPITFSLVGTPPAGVTYAFFTGFVRFSYTSGGTVGTANLRIAADDGAGNVTQSTQFMVQLVAPSVFWGSTPVVSFVAGEIKTVSVLPFLVNYNASSDTITIVQGVVPAWCPFNGTAFVSSGTQVDADDFGPIRLGVTRGGVTTASNPFSVTVTPVILPTAAGSLYTDFADSWNSMSGDYFSYSTRIPWRNNGGDFLDKNLTAHGILSTTAVPYDSVLCSTNGQTVSFTGTPIRDLVQRWVTRNTGAFLRARQPQGQQTAVKFSSRIGSNPPTLSVTAGATTYQCACRASAELPNGTSTPRVWPNVYDTEVLVSPGGQPNMLLQFDMTSVPAGSTVTSATMTLRVSQALGNPLTVDLFEVNTPRISIDPVRDAGRAPEVGGIAANPAYGDWDSGISADPNVIFSGDFSPGFSAKWVNYTIGTVPKPDSYHYTYSDDVRWPGKPGALPDTKNFYQSIPGTAPVSDPRFGGLYSLAWHYTNEEDVFVTTLNIVGPERDGVQLNRMFSLYNQPHLDSAWYRMELIGDGEPVGNQGNKYGPAIDFRMGYQRTDGAWRPVSGNGRVQNVGVFLPNFFYAKQSYPVGTTTATLAGAPKNGEYLYTQNAGGWLYWNDESLQKPLGCTFFHRAIPHPSNIIPDGPPGSPHRGVVADANGEIGLVQIEHYDAGGNWVTGTGDPWTTATGFGHELSFSSNPVAPTYSDWVAMTANPVNLRGGQYGFFSGGMARLGSSNNYYTQFEMRPMDGGGGNVKVISSYPNVVMMKAGDRFWLHHETPNVTQYTYNGPDITSTSAGEFIIPIASCTPNVLTQPLSSSPEAYFDCSNAYQRGALSDANPLRKHLAIHFYIYDCDRLQAPSSGMDYAIGDQTVGFPILKQGQRYSLEIGIFLNSVSGPFDAFGNGTGQRDGRMIVEVDGVRFMDQGNMLFRHHPGIQIMGFANDTTLGGNPRPRSLFHEGVIMGPYVGAKARIGPAKKPASTLPSYIQDLPEGSVKVISLNTMDAVNPATLQGPGGPGWDSGTNQYIWNSGKFTSITQAWAGVVYASEMGTFGRFVLRGGGDVGYRGTEVKSFSFDTQRWVLPNLSEPTIQFTGQPGTPTHGYSADPLFSYLRETDPEMKWLCEHGDITTSGARATGQDYDATVYLPPSMGGISPNGTFLICNDFANYGQISTGWAHMFDLNQTSNGHYQRASTGRIKDSGGATYNPTGQTTAALDTKRKVVWAFDSGTGYNRGFIGYLDLNGPAPWTFRWKLTTNNPNLAYGVPCTFYHAAQDGLIWFGREFIGSVNGNPSGGQYWILNFLDLSAVTSPIVTGTSDKITGYDSVIINPPTLPPFMTLPEQDAVWGMAWVPEQNSFYIYNAGRPAERLNIYKLTLPSNLRVQGWVPTITKLTMTEFGGSNLWQQDGPQSAPIFKRFCYIPKLKSICFFTKTNGPVLAYRIPGL